MKYTVVCFHHTSPIQGWKTVQTSWDGFAAILGDTPSVGTGHGITQNCEQDI